MANPKHLKMLEQGVEAWNKWRRKNDQIQPDLREANLTRANFSFGDPTGAEVMCDYTKQFFPIDPMWHMRAGVNLRGARLGGAILSRTDLLGADLSNADLKRADLGGANLTSARLIHASLRGAMLGAANLRLANMTKTDLRGAICGSTMFADIDLSRAVGLNAVQHVGPSSIGIDTIYKSQGQIPDQFLRRAGVPEEIIKIAWSIRSGPPIQWHSCFISYSTRDEDFARRLHSRMREANMRVWFAPEDLAGGKKLHEQLFSAIQVNDKLLLVLSTHSMQSEWVMTEIHKARDVEKKEKRRKLFPIRLIDYETLRAWTCFDADSGKDLAVEVREYFIPDFSHWKDHGAFEAAFKKLQADLKSEQP
jgi:hypothetical protein